jgi:transposase
MVRDGLKSWPVSWPPSDNSPPAGGIRRAPLGSHKGKAIRRSIRSAGAKLFLLPKYSPDLNPIEQVFAKLKHLLRNAAARTFEALIAAIGQLLAIYTTQECTNYFTNAGYGRTWKHPALVSTR